MTNTDQLREELLDLVDYREDRADSIVRLIEQHTATAVRAARQDDLINFLYNPETINKAVEGSMDKRLAAAPCPMCYGSGEILSDDMYRNCPTCEGAGRVTDLATDHSDTTTEPLKAAPSPTIDTELDRILEQLFRYNKTKLGTAIGGLSDTLVDLKKLIERETARARIDELQMLTTKAYQLHEDAEYPKKIERYAENRINDLAALTSPHERKDDK